MNKMNGKQIISYLSANDVPFSKGFIRAENDGCISEYNQLFQEGYEKIAEYVRFGMNNGFSTELKDGIEEVTKVIVAICGEKNTKGKAKLAKQLIDINAKMREEVLQNDNAAGKNNIAHAVLHHIEIYDNALNALIKKPETPRKEVLESASKKLAQVRSAVESTVDVCSTQALTFAQKVVESLDVWGKTVSENMHSESANGTLDTALADATAWAKKETGVVVVKGLFTRKSNLAQDLSSLKFKNAAIAEYVVAPDSIEKVRMFRENLEIFKKNIVEGRFNTEEDEVALEKQREKRAKLVKELDQNDIDYDNGLIDAETYNANGEDLEFEIGECDEEIKILRKQIAVMTARSRSYRKVIRKVEMLNRVIIGFQDDPKTLNYIVENIDFSMINNVLRGFASDEEILHVTELTLVTGELNRIAQEKLKDILEAFEKQEARLSDAEPMQQKNNYEESLRKAAEANRLAEERRARRRALREGGQPQPLQPVEGEQEVQKKSPVHSFADIVDDN